MKLETLPTPEALAKEFARVLRSWLNDDQWESMLRLNKKGRSPLICHSHDFCDANMAMDEAFKNLGVDQETQWGDDWASNEEASALWNKAWDIAKTKHLGGGA